jgi:prevent-host-death family protein
MATLVGMIDRIGVRELRNQVAAVIRRAGDGERLIVTVDGKPVAQLGPLTPDESGVTLWDLAGAGLVEPPRRSDRPPEPAPLPVAADLRVDRLMDQVRSR